MLENRTLPYGAKPELDENEQLTRDAKRSKTNLVKLVDKLQEGIQHWKEEDREPKQKDITQGEPRSSSVFIARLLLDSDYGSLEQLESILGHLEESLEKNWGGGVESLPEGKITFRGKPLIEIYPKQASQTSKQWKISTLNSLYNNFMEAEKTTQDSNFFILLNFVTTLREGLKDPSQEFYSLENHIENYNKEIFAKKISNYLYDNDVDQSNFTRFRTAMGVSTGPGLRMTSQIKPAKGLKVTTERTKPELSTPNDIEATLYSIIDNQTNFVNLMNRLHKNDMLETEFPENPLKAFRTKETEGGRKEFREGAKILNRLTKATGLSTAMSRMNLATKKISVEREKAIQGMDFARNFVARRLQEESETTKGSLEIGPHKIDASKVRSIEHIRRYDPSMIAGTEKEDMEKSYNGMVKYVREHLETTYKSQFERYLREKQEGDPEADIGSKVDLNDIEEEDAQEMIDTFTKGEYSSVLYNLIVYTLNAFITEENIGQNTVDSESEISKLKSEFYSGYAKFEPVPLTTYMFIDNWEAILKTFGRFFEREKVNQLSNSIAESLIEFISKVKEEASKTLGNLEGLDGATALLEIIEEKPAGYDNLFGQEAELKKALNEIDNMFDKLDERVMENLKTVIGIIGNDTTDKFLNLDYQKKNKPIHVYLQDQELLEGE